MRVSKWFFKDVDYDVQNYNYVKNSLSLDTVHIRKNVSLPTDIMNLEKTILQIQSIRLKNA